MFCVIFPDFSSPVKIPWLENVFPFYRFSNPSGNPGIYDPHQGSNQLVGVLLLPPACEVWGKVMFLHVSVILSTGGSATGRQPPLQIRSNGGRYASYWNAYLFIMFSIIVHNPEITWRTWRRTRWSTPLPCRFRLEWRHMCRHQSAERMTGYILFRRGDLWETKPPGCKGRCGC